ncbi:GMC family oxidoreductase N-terminal domain-containing protein [Methanobacterium sp. SMA-27]|uniref:GMC family oxidoreductase N-terminal domain-containing protein n=1 Tax=Methanobacterium sp. SMA-27 TaxID=1495336 RepID=UPI00064E7F73|nr:GMC family oxidoreductase N-terminal domain-containing protein [Methanobacterium sp. SMA-27]
MKVIVVGSGAGGGTAALELASRGYDVTILEAGKPFKPFSRHLTLIEPLRRIGLLGDERNINRIFPHMDATRSDRDLVLVRGITTGGSTAISCGNMVRADQGFKELGLDLTPEFEELEKKISIRPIPMKRWRPLTRKMYESAENLGFNPKPTPKGVKLHKCNSCGLCEMGCSTGARWDSNQFLNEALKMGAVMHTSSRVEKLLIENGHINGVLIRSGSLTKIVKGDAVVLAAGGVGTAQILKASGLEAQDKLWVDIVLTLGGVSKGAKQLNEPPMAWFTEHKDYILSPYLDILSHFFHKPWRNVSLNDRVGIMVKLADMEKGTVFSDGSVQKAVTEKDELKIDNAVSNVKAIMETSEVSGPFVKGMYNGGHLGGTVPLKKEDISSMKPSGLPEGLWIADLSLAPRSQGLPTIMLTSALAMRVCKTLAQ